MYFSVKTSVSTVGIHADHRLNARHMETIISVLGEKNYAVI
jgi:hypothetical protein